MMNIRKNNGFSLIEVMVALVILAIGILGISSLQGTLIQNSSNANQRSVAVSIAQKKIDDLKSYALLNSATAWTAETIPASGLAYTHIANNAGGAPAGSSELDAGTIPLGNTTYTLSWAVQDYLHTTALAAPIASTPGSGFADMKLVTVTVSWPDEAGITQQVALNTVIDSYPPSATAFSDNPSIGDIGPQPNYTPELAPDVIDVQVDLNNGANRQTSKPLPDAVKTGADSNTLVTFEVVTYQNAASEIIQTRREEFQTVDCTCQFNTTDGLGFPPAYAVWDDEDSERYDYIQQGSDGLAEAISKPTATQTGNANAVDELCDICCRDHHDDDASPVKYVAGTTTGDHVHYQADGTTVAVQADGDEYVESCRFKRVDGILRVFQDWQLYDITTMDRAALANVAAAGGIQDTYSTYVQNYVLNQVGVSTITPVKLDAVTDVSTGVGSASQLQVRGIYIDKVHDIGGSELPASYTSYITANPANDDRLEKIPFSELNLTLLADWVSSDVTEISVSSEPVATIADPATDYYGTYSRGYISALAETGASGIPVTATIPTNNNGFTQVDNATNTLINDPITVVVGPSAGDVLISGTYAITFPYGRTGSPDITITGGGTCILPGSPGNTYECTVPTPWSGTIQVSIDLTSGQKATRCGIDYSILYAGTSITTDTTHNFASFACATVP